MTKDITINLRQLEQNFRELIIERCRFCGFDKYLEENPVFELPKIGEDLLGWEIGQYIAIPGLVGGFDYFLDRQDDELVLYAEQSSRMDYSSDDYLYYEIKEAGSRLLQDEERKVVAGKFRELGRKRFIEHENERRNS